MNEYRFHLQKYKPGSKTVCPGCGRKSCFTRYIDEVGEISFPGYVGKCDHINSCGYHYSPKEYFRDNPSARETSAGHKMNSRAFTAVRYATKQPANRTKNLEFLIFPIDWVEQPCAGTASTLCTVTSQSGGKGGSRQVVPCLQSRHVKDVERFDRVLADRCQG